MTREELKSVFVEEFETIAPEINLLAISETANIQESFDLDSMDIYNLLAALHQRLGVDVAEKDVSEMLTIDSALDYLMSKLAS